jgi:hypothetical protein
VEFLVSQAKLPPTKLLLKQINYYFWNATFFKNVSSLSEGIIKTDVRREIRKQFPIKERILEYNLG